jgi:nucleotide-binding universal stress UspA family protein
VIGGTGTALSWVVVTFLHLGVALAGLAWFGLGAAVFWAYRRRQAISTGQTIKLQVPALARPEEVEYHSVLVATNAGWPAPGAAALAARMAVKRNRAIHVLVTINVAQHLPADADLPEEQRNARQIISQIKKITGRRTTAEVIKVRPGQASAAIISTAQRIGARALVMNMPPADRHASHGLFGRTIEKVLHERPCRVLLCEPITQRDPDGARIRADLYRHPPIVGPGHNHQAPLRNDVADPGRDGLGFERILVPALGSHLDEEVVQTAGRLALEVRGKQKAARLDLLMITKVPMAYPIGHCPQLAGFEPDGLRLVRAAAVAGDYERVDVQTHHVGARSIARAIINEARRLHSDAIVLPVAPEDLQRAHGVHRDSRGFEITRYVLTHAPCNVVLTAPALTDS